MSWSFFVLCWLAVININIIESCENDVDCSLLGKCNLTTNLCKCNNGFYGIHCDFIYLNTTINWNNNGYKNITTSSWDGWPIYDDIDDKYHLFISIIRNNCKLQGYWLTNSIIAHLISSTSGAVGPYVLSDVALYPNTKNKSSFDSLSVYNPAIIKVDSLYVLYYTATSSYSTNETSANCSSNNDELFKSVSSTQKIGVATSKSLYGPWIRSNSNPIIIPNNTNQHLWNSEFVTNPAPLLLQNGSIAVVYKAKPMNQGNDSKNTMYHGIAMSDNGVDGPYTTMNKDKAFNVPTYCADPFLWSSSNDTIFHIIFQCHWNCSQQIAFSNDLLNWNYFINDEEKWCNINTTNNNTDIELQRRERPALIFDNNKTIKYLFSAVQPQTGRTWNIVQSIG